MPGQNIQNRPIFPAWVSAGGPAADVAVSTRARLARNIQGYPFPNRARDVDLKQISSLVLEAVNSFDDRFGRLQVVYPSNLPEIDKITLVDTHLASRQHVDGGRFRPVVLNETGTLSLMVNEEDHLRIQCILPGLQPMTSLQNAQEFENLLGSKVVYANTDNYGYLTTSLGNVGTGLRLSVMLHLAGLAFLHEAVPALTAAAELKVSVRGLFGEGTRATGDIFQVSNETTIGFSEKEITYRVRAAAEHLISREREARLKLAREKKSELTDAVRRIRARLMEIRALSGIEAMGCLSVLRLGWEVGLESGISARTFNELLVSMRLGAHAPGKASPGGRVIGGIDNDVKRAGLVRARLIEESEVAMAASEEKHEPELQNGRHSK